MPYCHEPPSPNTCEICKRCETDPKFAEIIVTIPPPRKTASTTGLVEAGAEPCDYFEELSPAGREQRGLSHNRTWGLCTHPNRKLLGISEVVCPCLGCNSKCIGYTTEQPPASSGPPEWISISRMTRDAVVLSGLLPPDVTAVAGLPRSGMIPASIISTVRHLPLYELNREGLHPLGHGNRGGNWINDGVVAIVDDTVYSGLAMKQAKQVINRIGVKAIFTAVYSRLTNGVDYYVRNLPSPHILEWHLFNSGLIRGQSSHPMFRGGVGLDMDGIIIQDGQSGGMIGNSYLVPRSHPVPLICTGRPESLREVTEKVLARLGVRYDRLVMYPGASMPETNEVARYKAEQYKQSGCGLFVESDPNQAETIHQLTGRPVACPILEKVFV